jgi:hypothetical protein
LTDWQNTLHKKQEEVKESAKKLNITLPQELIFLWEQAYKLGEKNGYEIYKEFERQWAELEKHANNSAHNQNGQPQLNERNYPNYQQYPNQYGDQRNQYNPNQYYPNNNRNQYGNQYGNQYNNNPYQNSYQNPNQNQYYGQPSYNNPQQYNQPPPNQYNGPQSYPQDNMGGYQQNNNWNAPSTLLI